ncbi:MAG: hypothetical protein H6683_05765 [Deltaproteobacteria bacterium]|nr:hypothetical protein [Deltaproteobacteria bacterium]
MNTDENRRLRELRRSAAYNRRRLHRALNELHPKAMVKSTARRHFERNTTAYLAGAFILGFYWGVRR